MGALTQVRRGAPSSRRTFVHSLVAGTATLAVSRPARAAASETDATATGSAGPVPIQRIRTAGDRSLPATGGAWRDVDPDGNAAARPLDLVVTGVGPGDWVRLTLTGQSNPNTGTARFSFASIVSGVAVHRVMGDLTPGCWVAPPAVAAVLSGTVSYQVQADDVEAGSVRFRLVYRSTGLKGVFASTANGPLVVEATGPFA